jgi:hypothetical protein
VFLTVIRRCGRSLLEASLIPSSLFYCCLIIGGLGVAYASAIIWLYVAVLSRVVRQRPVPPLLVLGAIGITVRTKVSILSGSTFLYFAQPIVGSLVMGCVFLISVWIGRPMAEKLALEFWPLTPEMLARPAVNRLLRRLTLLWAGTNLTIGAATLTLLLCLPMTTYVAVKQLASLGITATAVAITIHLSVRTARSEGFAARPPRRASARSITISASQL